VPLPQKKRLCYRFQMESDRFTIPRPPQVFEAIKMWMLNRGVGLKGTYWMCGLLGFVISPFADSLTSALLVGAVRAPLALPPLTLSQSPVGLKGTYRMCGLLGFVTSLTSALLVGAAPLALSALTLSQSPRPTRDTVWLQSPRLTVICLQRIDK
jgi:hypothetical protein